MQTFLQDTRFGARLLVRNPGFAAMAVLALALGIGGSTAIFSAVNAVLVRPLPYPDADRLLKEGIRLSIWGLGLGLIGTLALSRMLRSLLYGVGESDPVTFAVVTLLLAAVALVATYLPARRASRIHPMVALRYE